MLPILTPSRFDQIIALYWTKWQLQKHLQISAKQHGQIGEFHLATVLHKALYQNCSNRLALLDKMTT